MSLSRLGSNYFQVALSRCAISRLSHVISMLLWLGGGYFQVALSWPVMSRASQVMSFSSRGLDGGYFQVALSQVIVILQSLCIGTRYFQVALSQVIVFLQRRMSSLLPGGAVVSSCLGVIPGHLVSPLC
jgi:hypothetical protein